MKRLKIGFLLLVATFIFSSCGGRDKNLQNWVEPNGKLKILSTTAHIAALTESVGGERVDNLVLIIGDLNPHAYELVKGDGEKAARADIIFFNGLGLEHGASLSSLLKDNPKAVAVGEWVATHHEDKILKTEGVVDPHIWMDISLWEKGIDPILERLIELDPEGTEYYTNRAAAIRAEMERVDSEIQALLEKVPEEKRYLVTSHDAFHYFTRRYLAGPHDSDWKERVAAPEGLAPDGQLNPVDLLKIMEYLKKHKVTVLFPESNVNRDSIRKIASAGKEMGLKIEICEETLYGDSTSGLSYLESMRQNATVISTHLKAQ